MNAWYDSNFKKIFNVPTKVADFENWLVKYKLSGFSTFVSDNYVFLYVRSVLGTKELINFISFLSSHGIKAGAACSSLDELDLIKKHNLKSVIKIDTVVTELEPYNHVGTYEEMTALMKAVKNSGLKLGVYAGWYDTYFETIQTYADFINLHCYIPVYSAANVQKKVLGRLTWIKKYNDKLNKKTVVNCLISIEDWENDDPNSGVRFGYQFLKQYGLQTLVNNVNAAMKAVYPYYGGCVVFKTKYGMELLK